MMVNAREKNEAHVENTKTLRKATILNRAINESSLRKEYFNILGNSYVLLKHLFDIINS